MRVSALAALVVFAGCNNITNNQLPENTKQKNDVIVDTVVVNEIELKDICFVIEESNYPEIKGLADKIFEKLLNDLFRSNFNAHIDSAKVQHGGCMELVDADEESSFFNSPTSAGSGFETLTRNDEFISIVQTMSLIPGQGANYWVPSSAAVTADIQNRIIWGTKDFKIDIKQSSFLNSRIKAYFDILFPEDKAGDAINYPLIETQEDFDKLHFGIRNDSVVIIMEAWPTAHYSYTTYIVPIDKLKRK